MNRIDDLFGYHCSEMNVELLEKKTIDNIFLENELLTRDINELRTLMKTNVSRSKKMNKTIYERIKLINKLFRKVDQNDELYVNMYKQLYDSFNANIAEYNNLRTIMILPMYDDPNIVSLNDVNSENNNIWMLILIFVLLIVIVLLIYLFVVHK